jgi:hypothetical protein
VPSDYGSSAASRTGAGSAFIAARAATWLCLFDGHNLGGTFINRIAASRPLQRRPGLPENLRHRVVQGRCSGGTFEAYRARDSHSRSGVGGGVRCTTRLPWRSRPGSAERPSSSPPARTSRQPSAQNADSHRPKYGTSARQGWRFRRFARFPCHLTHAIDPRMATATVTTAPTMSPHESGPPLSGGK